MHRKMKGNHTMSVELAAILALLTAAAAYAILTALSYSFVAHVGHLVQISGNL